MLRLLRDPRRPRLLLLVCDAWAWVGLTVHVLRPHSTATQRELRLYERARAALRGYARVTEGPHGS